MYTIHICVPAYYRDQDIILENFTLQNYTLIDKLFKLHEILLYYYKLTKKIYI